MKGLRLLLGWMAVMLCSAGCEPAATCRVTQYGPRHMTYTGPGGQFGDACRQVLHELGYRERVDDNTVRYPHHAEGVSSHEDNEKPIAKESYMKTRDGEGAEYEITEIRLGDLDPVVILESTSSDPHRLVNALNAEFARRGFRVVPY